MKSLRHVSLVSICCIALVMLSACGGGSSSSGVGKSAAGANVGRYAGFGEGTMSAPGMAPYVFPFVIIIVVNADNTVILDPETPIPGTGTITGNTITAAYPANAANSPGVSCTGIIAANGIVTGDTITGNIGPSTFPCNGIPFSLHATYTAARVPAVPAQGPGFRKQGIPLGTVIRDTARLRAPPATRDSK